MKKTLLALLFLTFSFDLLAKDFGVMGKIYEIYERDLLIEIQEQLQAMEKDGRLQKFQQSVRRDMFSSLGNPAPIRNIKKANESRSWLFDPSISWDRDLYDQNGRMFYKAYSKVNPLDKISLTKSLIFIDGSDKDQISFAISKLKSLKGKAKIVLVKGEVLNLMKKYKTRLYFDQNAKLVTKFKIKFVPAIVKQEDRMLRISEVAI